MSDTIIRVENLGKMYRIGAKSKAEGLRHALEDGVRRLGRRLTGKAEPKSKSEDFWALKDVSFEVKRGECVGIIGRNGAGKSTLLKILSRITEPTTGQIRMKGRVGSLLEVGTGFHPELTGRENIFLNGAILGMGREEIARKFDEIVAFSEIERFLDTAVKYFSSGMYTRLAFSVAAHLEPEILIVDEVLAVGDAAFQKKCLGKMGEVAKGGRTVLFVSHNMAAVNRLCGRSIFLECGLLIRSGTTDDVLSTYLLQNSSKLGERRWDPPGRPPGNDSIQLRRLGVLDPNGKTTSTVDIRNPFDLEMEIDFLKPVTNLRLAFRILTDDGVTVFTSTDQNASWQSPTPRLPGRYRSLCRIPGDLLNTGNYTITACADFPFVEVIFFEEQALRFHVEQTGGVSGKYPEKWPGVICPNLDWKLEPLHPCTSTINP